MLEDKDVGLASKVLLLSFRLEAGRPHEWSSDPRVAENGQQSVPVDQLVFPGMPVVGVLVHDSREYLVDVDVVDVAQEGLDYTSLLLAVDAICY